MKIIQEFRSFIQRGNVLDMAVGVIIGNAFGKIVSSLVADIIMPPIGLLAGGIDLAKMKVKIGMDGVTPIYWNYGNFLQVTLDFLIIAFAIFFVIKVANTLRQIEEKLKIEEILRLKQETVAAAPVQPSAEIMLLTEIRDLMREKK